VEKKPTHAGLVAKTAQWCINRGYYPVCTDYLWAGYTKISYDVIAFRFAHSFYGGGAKYYQIRVYNFEIKVSRRDYFADKNKVGVEPTELCKPYKIYVAPKHLIAKSELYKGCGLLEYQNGRFYQTEFYDCFQETFELNANFDFLFRAAKISNQRMINNGEKKEG